MNDLQKFQIENELILLLREREREILLRAITNDKQK